MNARVLPSVRFLIPCDHAARDPEDGKWVVKNPLSIVQIPDGANFPFRADELFIYGQFSGGLGEFDIMIEMLHVPDRGPPRSVGYTEACRVEFLRGSRLVVKDEGFIMKSVPFREAGIYLFRATSEGQRLEGMAFEVPVLDRRQIV